MSWAVSPQTLEGLWRAWGEGWARARGLEPRALEGGGDEGGVEAKMWREWGLSARLAQVAAFFPEGHAALDIGADHALLPLALTRAGRAPAALAVDVNAAPLEGARRRLRADDRVALVLADGFEALEPARGGREALGALLGGARPPLCVTICGVGGRLVAELMARAPLDVERAVLQPNLQHERVVDALSALGWRVEGARLTLEGGRLFLTLSARRLGADALRAPLDPPDLERLLRDDPLCPLWLWVHLERVSARAPSSLEGLPAAAADHWRAQRARRDALHRSLSALVASTPTPQE